MYVVFNTRPDVMPEAVFAWITNAIETIASTTIWLPTTSATTALAYRKLLNKWANDTNPEMLDFVQWQGHDFSYRGHSSNESAITSAAGHALSFTGSDTVPVADFLEEYYNADSDKELVVGSVAATEHSVMCMGGLEDEVETFRRLIEDLYPTGLVSIVSDTWDFWNVVDPVDGICVQLKDKIMAREGKVVIRPDSGDPVKIVTGYMHDELDVDADGNYFDRETKKPLTENEVKGMIVCLYEIFGGTETSKGYIQLDPHIGAIYGDSITLTRAEQICERLAKKGFASTNVVFGIGSYTYQYVTRDTYGFAVKSTYGEVIDEDGTTRGIEIFKDPKTDDGLKKSAKGLTAVFEQDGTFVLKDQATWDEVKNCAFVQVYANGKITKDWTLAEIRATVAKNL
jgi:nicotinamide phosphoribosyltransferase